MERRNQNKLPFSCWMWTVKHGAACYNSWKWSNYRIKKKYEHLVVGKTLVCYVDISNACMYSLIYGCNIVTHIIPAWIAAHMHTNGVLPSWIKCFDCFACWGLETVDLSKSSFYHRQLRCDFQPCRRTEICVSSWSWMMYLSLEWGNMWQLLIVSVKSNQFFSLVRFYYLTQLLYMPPW